MGLLEDYVKLDAEMRAKYGPTTVVLMQCGDFYELYAIDNDTERAGADIYRIGDICNLIITRKNKAILENGWNNPLMAGFPLHAKDKNVQALLACNYTIVVVQQITPPPKVERAITEIVSPGTGLVASRPESQFLMVCFWDSATVAGLAGIDLSTGETWLIELGSEGLYDEITRLLETWNPREIAVYSRRSCAGAGDGAERVFGGSGAAIHWFRDQYPPECERPHFQNALLARAYRNLGESPIELLGIERLDAARLAFVLLIQFAYEHNSRAIEHIRIPEVLDSKRNLVLENTSAIQLNILSHTPGERCLLALLNRCSTAFGRRLFRRRLMEPVVDAAELERRYDRIEREMGAGGGAAAPAERAKKLARMMDLERMLRRIRLGTFHPSDWSSLDLSIQIAEELGFRDWAAQIRSGYGGILELEKCSKYLASEIASNIFCGGYAPDLDELDAEIEGLFAEFRELSEKVVPGSRIERNDRDGYFLTTTKKRWGEAGGGADAAAFKAVPISATSSTLRLTSPATKRLSAEILEKTRRMTVEAATIWRRFLGDFADAYADIFAAGIREIAEFDVALTNARNAIDYAYVRPRICGGGGGSAGPSHLKVRGMRHPIIERIQTDIPYVDNDIELGPASNVGGAASEACCGAAVGLLLYGINAAGKSSLMKAVGLTVVMAQAGMFVAAAECELAPFAHLFTRIQMVDNIYRGMSSFTVEMTELRAILRRADANSLVLGDELCAGTEATSAISIVAAGIDALLEAGAAFVFATHLHELGRGQILNTHRLQIAHLAVEVSDDGEIRYDRRLRPGSGSDIYGLEVCRGLRMPAAFLKRADQVRRQLMGEPMTLTDGLKPSHYNRRVILDRCGVCEEAAATETHHIVFQCQADERGQIGAGRDLHGAANLVGLCEKCHLETHHGTLKIVGWGALVGGRRRLIVERGGAGGDGAADEGAAGAAAGAAGAAEVRYTERFGWRMKNKGRWTRKTYEEIVAFLTEQLGGREPTPEELDALRV